MSGAVRFDMDQQRAALNRIRAEIKGYLETMIANRILMSNEDDCQGGHDHQAEETDEEQSLEPTNPLAEIG